MQIDFWFDFSSNRATTLIDLLLIEQTRQINDRGSGEDEDDGDTGTDGEKGKLGKKMKVRKNREMLKQFRRSLWFGFLRMIDGDKRLRVGENGKSSESALKVLDEMPKPIPWKNVLGNADLSSFMFSGEGNFDPKATSDLHVVNFGDALNPKCLDGDRKKLEESKGSFGPARRVLDELPQSFPEAKIEGFVAGHEGYKAGMLSSSKTWANIVATSGKKYDHKVFDEKFCFELVMDDTVAGLVSL